MMTTQIQRTYLFTFLSEDSGNADIPHRDFFPAEVQITALTITRTEGCFFYLIDYHVNLINSIRAELKKNQH
jgi:nicotinate-nucleotide pyrophosphorylase